MPLSKKDIYNNALAKVSRGQVSSVDEDSHHAKLCNTLYDKALSDALFEHSWSSCIKRIKLVETTTDPVQAYGHSFQLPNDFIRLIQAYTSTDKLSFDFEWEKQENQIHTNAESVWIKYVYTPQNVEQMNTPLVAVLVHKLAIALAYPMKAADDREAGLIEQYERIVLPRAKSQDSMESRFLENEESPWIESLYKTTPQ